MLAQEQFGNAPEITQPQSATVEVRTAPVAIRAVRPGYPMNAVRMGLEGYVVLSFTVDKEGRVIDPKVEKSTSPMFESAALKAARQLKYEPSLDHKGEPMEINHYYKFTFEISDRGELTRAFQGRYKAFQDFYKAANRPEALRSLKELDPEFDKEQAYTHLARYLYSDKFEDNDATRSYYIKKALATVYGRDDEFYLDSDMIEPLLVTLFQLQIRNKFFAEALLTYSRIEELSYLESVEEYRSTYKKILALKTSDEVYSVNLTRNIKNSPARDITPIKLFRREFYLSGGGEDINELKLACDEKTVYFDFADGESYMIPESWGDCKLVIYGKTDSEIVYTQL